MGGSFAGDRALNWQWDTHWAFSVTPCFLCLSFPPLALVPLSCSQHCLFCMWGKRGKRVSSSASSSYSSSLMAACAHLHSLYDTIQPHFQPGSGGSMARHTHFPLTSNFSIWKVFNALSQFLFPIHWQLRVWEKTKDSSALGASLLQLFNYFFQLEGLTNRSCFREREHMFGDKRRRMSSLTFSAIPATGPCGPLLPFNAISDQWCSIGVSCWAFHCAKCKLLKKQSTKSATNEQNKTNSRHIDPTKKY